VSENRRFAYQPALDGVRAFAVLSVLAYFDYMNRRLRDYARAHADRTSVVDLAGLLCPNGTQPCPEEVSGVRPRPTDGNHFEPDTAVWVAHQLMPEIMAATPGAGIDAATSNDPTTNASVGKHA
jgi:hypothetical protein